MPSPLPWPSTRLLVDRERSPGEGSARRSGLAVVFLSMGLILGSLICQVLLVPRTLLADGGTLRVGNVAMGAYRVNIFTDPTPIPPDTVDVSALVTFERGRGVATGLDIAVVASRTDGTGPVLSRAATREQATDPRYYSAKFALGSTGEWEIQVSVRGPEGEGQVAFQITCQEPGLWGNPYLVLAASLIPLLVMGVWLRRTR